MHRFTPSVEELPFCDAPLAEPRDFVALRVCLAHIRKHRAIVIAQPFVAFVCRRHRENVIVRSIKETPFEPAAGIPGIESDEPLNVVAVRQLATQRLVDAVKCVLIDLVRLLTPSPAQYAILDSDRCHFQRVVKPAKEADTQAPAETRAPATTPIRRGGQSPTAAVSNTNL